MDQQKQEIVSPLEVGELAQRAAIVPTIMDIKSPDGMSGQFALVPTVSQEGRATASLVSVAKFYDEYRPNPVRRVGSANLCDVASLVAHVNRFKDADSVVFADTNRARPSITAVLDYHRAGSGGSPRFGQHRSHYAFPVSDEWTVWTKAHGREMGQGDFAEFIEAHMVDVIERPPVIRRRCSPKSAA
jgi:hypothetical protein